MYPIAADLCKKEESGNMYRTIFFVLMCMSIATIVLPCKIDCGDLCLCMDFKGYDSLCNGFIGCHEDCPIGSVTMGCKKGKRYFALHQMLKYAY